MGNQPFNSSVRAEHPDGNRVSFSNGKSIEEHFNTKFANIRPKHFQGLFINPSSSEEFNST